MCTYVYVQLIQGKLHVYNFATYNGESVEPPGMKRHGKNCTRRIEGTPALNPLVDIAKLNFRLIVSHFAIAFHSHVYTYAYDTSTAGTIRTRVAAREPDDKSEVRPLVF